MADDKKGRDKQARDTVRRQLKREIAEEVERMDESEPPIDPAALAYFETELEALSFPVTGTAVIDAIGDREVEFDTGSYTVAELIPETDLETFDSPTAVRVQIQRPTVATGIKRILETADTLPNMDLSQSQRNAYKKTLQSLKAIDSDDDDEGIQAITDWIIEEIQKKEKLPGSRAVRREAAKFCRENGYQIRNDEWLGI